MSGSNKMKCSVIVAATAVLAISLTTCNSVDSLAGGDPPAGQDVAGKAVIETVEPSTILANRRAPLVVKGRNFRNTTQVLVGNLPPEETIFVSSERIDVVAQPMDAGTVSVTLAAAPGDNGNNGNGGDGNSGQGGGNGTGDGTTGDEQAAGVELMVRLGVSPAAGPVTGGTLITIFSPEERNNIAADDKVLFAVLHDPATDPSSPQFSFEDDVRQVDVALETSVINNSLATAITPAHAEGPTAVFLTSNQGQIFYLGRFDFQTSVPSDGGPRLVSAVSTSNRSVRVSFSEAVQGSAGSGALDPTNYVISQENENPESGVLLVTAAAFEGDDQLVVALTTAAQSEVMYELSVTGVKDLSGNILAPPELLVDPTKALFVGTPLTCVFGVCSGGGATCALDSDCGGGTCTELTASAGSVCATTGATCTSNRDCTSEPCVPGCGSADSDGDGLSDASEQRGWKVTVQLVNGDEISRTVTSNPTVADTDGDGLSDREERIWSLDPRVRDTDADQFSDYDELNVWFSDPWDQDTDDDTLSDWLDAVFFGTSPLIDDTDGDQMDDAEELLTRNRNPLVADLPVPQVTVDEVRLDLEITSSFTDEEGRTQSVSDTTSATLTQSRTRTIGQSSTVSTQTENQFSQEAGFEYGTTGAKGYGKVSSSQSNARGYSSTVDRQDSRTSQQTYQESVTRAVEQSERRSVTRNIDSALIQATVNIANQSDLAFTITNIELSVLQQDRGVGLSFRPIATLRPSGASDPLAQPSFNLGPLDPERGPIIFENVEVFPNLIDDLMREPTGLVFKVANFDVLDEFGRNLAFTTQDVNDRTAGFTIDFGDGTVETYQIATNSTFDGISGEPIGITMQRALEIVGITKGTTPDTTLPAGDITPAIRNSYGTVMVNGVEELTRVRGVQNDLGSVDPEKRAWFALYSDVDISPLTNFSDTPIRAKDRVLLAFTRDVDGDLLFEREEYLYGSSDNETDTDGDGIGDFDEVRTGWLVARIPGLPYRTFPSPIRGDSDLDGLEDPDERIAGTDPNRADTDEDGLSDPIELNDSIQIALFDGDDNPLNDPLITISPYSDQVILSGANGTCDTTTATGDDEVVTTPIAAAGAVCVTSGADGVINTTPAGDDVIDAAASLVPGIDGMCQTSTASGDDVVEATGTTAATLGSKGAVCISAGNDGVLQTVADANSDDYERVVHRGLFTTDPLNFDTDADGIGDGREVLVGVNPNRRDAGNVVDTDGDGLFDQEEDDGWLAMINGSLVAVTSDKFRADTDRDGIPDVLERAIGSDPRSKDTDGDLLLDYFEFDQSDEIDIYDPLEIAFAIDRCTDAENCSYVAPDANLLIGTDPRSNDTDGDGRGDKVELDTTWLVSLFNGDQETVRSSPKFADEDSDGLNDSGEFAAGSHPQVADTDGDGRLDGDETGGLNPLRQDYSLTVTLTTVNVIGDCDASTCEGLEMKGTFSLRKPDGSETTLATESCKTEECACEVRDCCDDSKCEGESFTYNSGSSFVFSEGTSFTVFTNTLEDTDDVDCDLQALDDSIGSVNESFDFSLSLQSSLSVDVGTDDSCKVRVNYTFAR